MMAGPAPSRTCCSLRIWSRSSTWPMHVTPHGWTACWSMQRVSEAAPAGCAPAPVAACTCALRRPPRHRQPSKAGCSSRWWTSAVACRYRLCTFSGTWITRACRSLPACAKCFLTPAPGVPATCSWPACWQPVQDTCQSWLPKLNKRIQGAQAAPMQTMRCFHCCAAMGVSSIKRLSISITSMGWPDDQPLLRRGIYRHASTGPACRNGLRPCSQRIPGWLTLASRQAQIQGRCRECVRATGRSDLAAHAEARLSHRGG